MICDFGISRMVKGGVTVTGTDTFKFSIHYLAIEPVIPSDSAGTVAANRLHTIRSDIWAMGMVFYVRNCVDLSKITTKYHLRNC